MHIPNDPSDVVVGLELALGHREEGRKTEGRETSADDIRAAMFVPDFPIERFRVHCLLADEQDADPDRVYDISVARSAKTADDRRVPAPRAPGRPRLPLPAD